MGKTYVSLPHFSYAPASINPNEIPSKRWEIRSLTQCSSFSSDNKVLSWLSLYQDENQQMDDFSSNLRRKIRKAQSMKFSTETGHQELIPDFYTLFSTQMHRLGSPAMEQSFYRYIVNQLGLNHSRVFLIKHESRVIGAAILIFYRDFAETCWVATDPVFHKSYVSYWLHWTVIVWCISHNIHTYSFGRSTRNSGVHQFKQQWGTTDHTLYRNFSHPQPITLRNNVILAKTWISTPKPITHLLGPTIARKFY